MKLFIASLTTFFAAPLIGYFWVRNAADSWPPPGMPGLPSGMWAATLILIVSSITMQSALNAVRRGELAKLNSAMMATLVLATGFLVIQGWNWAALLSSEVTATETLYGFTFYVLTGMHALHVIGGILPMAVVTRRALAGGYSPKHYPGVQLCAMYWHFLGVVWLVLFASLYLTL